MRRFNQRVLTDPGLDAALVPIGDGCWSPSPASAPLHARAGRADYVPMRSMTVHDALPVLRCTRTGPAHARRRGGAVRWSDRGRPLIASRRASVSAGLELSAGSSTRAASRGRCSCGSSAPRSRAGQPGSSCGRGVVQDEQRRNDPRFPAGGEAHLVAVNCQEVVDGDSVRGRIVDVSASGVAITTDRVLRRGDRLRFQGRFFTEAIEAEVRVMSIRGADTGRRIYGCRFLEIGRREPRTPPARPRRRPAGARLHRSGRPPRPHGRGRARRPAAGAADFAARPDRSVLTPRSSGGYWTSGRALPRPAMRR